MITHRLKITFYRYTLQGFAYTRWFPRMLEARRAIQLFGCDAFPCSTEQTSIDNFTVKPELRITELLCYCFGLAVRQRLSQLFRKDSKIWISDPTSFLLLVPCSTADLNYYHASPRFMFLYDQVVCSPDLKANVIAYFEAYLRMLDCVPEDVSEVTFHSETEDLYVSCIEKTNYMLAMREQYAEGFFTTLNPFLFSDPS